MDWVKDDGGLLRRVSPFRYLRIVGYLLLPEAFRSLSRLSSALSAKASTICSFLHDQLPKIHMLRRDVFSHASSLAHRHSVAGVGSRPIFSVRFLRTSWLMFFYITSDVLIFLSRFLVCGFQGTWLATKGRLKALCFYSCSLITKWRIRDSNS